MPRVHPLSILEWQRYCEASFLRGSSRGRRYSFSTRPVVHIEGKRWQRQARRQLR